MNALSSAPPPADGGVLAHPGEPRDSGIEVEVEIEDEAWLAVLPEAPALVRQAARAALGAAAAGGAVVLLTDDDTLRDLNHRFRGRDAPTNVLAFPAAPGPARPVAGAGPSPLGDIAVAFGVCDAEARAQGKPLADHLRHLVAHGILHLLGHDHQEDDAARAMEGLERRLLAGIGVPDPYGDEPSPGSHATGARDLDFHDADSRDHVAKDTSDHVP